MAIIYTVIDVEQAIGEASRVSQWIREAITEENYRLGEITIALCSDSYIHKENVRFLGHDYATDIITFDYSKRGKLSGDLLISVETVAANAQEYGVSFDEELMRVVIHGVLHMCGYGDKEEQEQMVMRSREDYYLEKLFHVKL